MASALLQLGHEAMTKGDQIRKQQEESASAIMGTLDEYTRRIKPDSDKYCVITMGDAALVADFHKEDRVEVHVHVNTTITVRPPEEFHGKVHPKYEQDENVLPLALMAPMTGTPAACAFRPPTYCPITGPSNPQKYLCETYRTHNTLVVVAEGTMQLDVVGSTKYRLNGVGVVLTDKGLPDDLDDVDQSLLSSIIGPYGRRLAKSTKTNKVYDLMSRCEVNIDEVYPTNVPTVTDLESTTLFTQGEFVSIEDALRTNIVKGPESFGDFLKSIEFSLSDDTHARFVDMAIALIKKHESDNLTFRQFDTIAFKEKLKKESSLFAEDEAALDQRVAIERYRMKKSDYKKARSYSDKLFKKLNEFRCRATTSTTKSTTLAQELKKNIINANVDAVKGMSSEDFYELIESCELGVILPITSHPTGAIKNSQESPSECFALSQIHNEAVLPHVSTYDGCTLAALMSITQENGIPKTLSMRCPNLVIQVAGRDNFTAFSLPIPSVALSTKLNEFRGKVDDPVVAQLRIAMAGCLATLGGNLNPTHKNMRRMMAMLYLLAVEKAPRLDETQVRGCLFIAATSAWAGQCPSSFTPAILFDSHESIDIKDQIDWQLLCGFLNGAIKMYSITNKVDEIKKVRYTALRTFVTMLVKKIRKFITAVYRVQNPTSSYRFNRNNNEFWATEFKDHFYGETGSKRHRRMMRVLADGRLGINVETLWPLLFSHDKPVDIENASDLYMYCARQENKVKMIGYSGPVDDMVADDMVADAQDADAQDADAHFIIDDATREIATKQNVSEKDLRLIREQMNTLATFASDDVNASIDSVATLLNVDVVTMRSLLTSLQFPMDNLEYVKNKLDYIISFTTAHGLCEEVDVVVSVTSRIQSFLEE